MTQLTWWLVVEPYWRALAVFAGSAVLAGCLLGERWAARPGLHPDEEAAIRRARRLLSTV